MNFREYLTENYRQLSGNEQSSIDDDNIGLIYLGISEELYCLIPEYIMPKVMMTNEISHLARVIHINQNKNEKIFTKDLIIHIRGKRYFPYIYQGTISREWFNEIKSHRFKSEYIRVICEDPSEDSIDDARYRASLYDPNGKINNNLGDLVTILLPRNYLADGLDRITIKRIGSSDNATEEIKRINILVHLDTKILSYPSDIYQDYDLIIPGGYEVIEPIKNISHDSDIKIITRIISPPIQSYPPNTKKLIEGTQLLILKGEPKCGKTTLARYLLDDYKVGTIDRNSRKLTDKLHTIIENATQFDIDLINECLRDRNDTKLIITTKLDMPKADLIKINKTARFVDITRKLYDESLVVSYEECSFP